MEVRFKELEREERAFLFQGFKAPGRTGSLSGTLGEEGFKSDELGYLVEGVPGHLRASEHYVYSMRHAGKQLKGGTYSRSWSKTERCLQKVKLDHRSVKGGPG